MLSVVGRNGMGKTTLCNTIAGLKRARSGSIRVDGREVSALEPHEIHSLGVGYVPQGRRVWPSLTVDEHLRLAAGTSARRRLDGRAGLPDLSAARRAARQWRLAALRRRAADAGDLAGAAERSEAAGHGRADRGPGAGHRRPGRAHAGRARRGRRDGGPGHRAEYRRRHRGRRPRRDHGQWPHQPHHGRQRALAADRELQQRLLGRRPPCRRGAERRRQPRPPAEQRVADVFRVERGGSADGGERRRRRLSARSRELPNRWNVPVTALRQAARRADAAPADDRSKVFAMPLAERIGRTVLVAGTFDTKGKELRFIADRLKALGIPVRTVDLSTSGKPSSADVPAHAGGQHASARHVGGSCRAIAASRSRPWRRPSRAGSSASRASAASSRPAARAAPRWPRPACGALPVGIPKIMVSTVAAGDVGRYVGGADIMMFHSVADVQGLNSITEQVLGNAAHAMAGMVAQLPDGRGARSASASWPGRRVGITMFGVTTPCRAGGHQAARGRLRLPGLPRHRHRRAVDGEPRRFAAAGGLHRPHHHRGRRHDRRRRLRRPTQDRFGARHPHRPALCRLGRRARHGQFRPARHACRRNSAAANSSSTIPTSR